MDELMLSYDAWSSRVHPYNRERTEGELRRTRDAHDEFDAEFRTVHPDGTVRWLRGRGRYFHDEAGEAARMVGAMVDMTERREWEDRQKLFVAELLHHTRNLMEVCPLHFRNGCSNERVP